MDISTNHDIVYVGTTEGGYEVLRNLLKSGVPVSELITLTPEQGAQYDVAGFQKYDDLVKEYDIPVYTPSNYKMTSESTYEHLRRLSPDLFIVNGWQRLLPEEILETSTRGALGVHGSAMGLPKGRGRSPMNWSLIEDLDRFLLSVIKLDEGVDSGKIVDTEKFDITEFDTIRTMYYKLAITTTNILVQSLGPILRGEFEFTEQAGEPTYYPKRNPDDGKIHWGESTSNIYNLIRAVSNPYPGAFSQYNDEYIHIWNAIPFSTDLALDASPGEIIQLFKTTDEFVIRTVDGTLLIREWTAEEWTPSEGQILESLGQHTRADEDNHD